MDLLRVLHDHCHRKWALGQILFLLLDDVKHAFGSVQHETLKALLEVAGVDGPMVDVIMGAATQAKIFMGGSWGVTIAATLFAAGIAQGCPLSALLFCLVIQLRIAIVTAGISPTLAPAGEITNLAYVDDVTYTPDTERDFRRVAKGLHEAGVRTHLHSAPLKAKGLAVARMGARYQFSDPGIVLGGGTLSMATADEYVRVVGRHALPHLFHREDYAKLMRSCRRAAIALRCVKLPAHYPLLMYSAAGGGMQRWMSAVRPPSYGAIRVCDQPAASVVRQVTGWSETPSAQMFQPVETGWVGVEPAMVVMVEHFAFTYLKQLNHRNPAVRRSTQQGLWVAHGRYHADMPCVRTPFGKKCIGHDTDHDKMYALLKRSGFEIAFPQYLTAHTHAFPMASCRHAWQAEQLHLIIDTGVRSLDQAAQTGWPVPDWAKELQPLPPLLAHPIKPYVPEIQRVPEDLFTVADGSWYSRVESGGAFAVGSIHAGWVDYYQVQIPVALDHAYMVELYVAWILLLALQRSGTPASAVFYRRAEIFHDCQSYISAVESDNDPTNHITRSLLQACRDLLPEFTAPQHLRSHKSGTYLDDILDKVDETAKKTAKAQSVSVGWVDGLQSPQVCLLHEGTQMQDVTSTISRSIRSKYYEQFNVEMAPKRAELQLYATIVARGMVTWALHLHTVARRQNLWSPWSKECKYCALAQAGNHLLKECPARSMYEYYIYCKIALWVPEVVPVWRRAVPTPWGVWIQVSSVTYVLAFHPPITFPLQHAHLELGLTGEVPSQSYRLMRKSGASKLQLRQLMASLLQCVHIVHVAKHPPQIPITQTYKTPGQSLHVQEQILLFPDQHIDLVHWEPSEDPQDMWPYIPFLYALGLKFHMFVAIPIPGMPLYIFHPVASLRCDVLYWYHTLDRVKGWPSSLPNVPDVLLYDWHGPLQARGCYTGDVLWIMEYGYPENTRCITAVRLNPLVACHGTAQAMLRAFMLALHMVSLPTKVMHRNYQVSMQQVQLRHWSAL